MSERLACIFLGGIFFCLLTGCSSSTTSASVIIDASSTSGTFRDVLGLNKAPRGTDASGMGANTYNLAAIYQMLGVSNVRTLDSFFDVCEVYTDDTLVNAANSQTLSNCVNGTGTHAVWSANSGGANVNNVSSYSFTTVDLNLDAIYSSGAGMYLRLGENNNGPNDTTDFSSWTAVAKNLYRHVSGVSSGFGIAPSHTVAPAYIELTNEPDSSFWMGTKTDYYTLYQTAWDAIDAIAPSTVKIGGSGFSTTFETHLGISSNVAAGFIAAVTVPRIDFFSAHVYGSCDSATLSEMGTHLSYLRSYMNSNGLSAKPLVVSEWNVGLNCSTENSFHASRAQSFNAAILSLMEDTSLNIERAHYYGGFGQMSFLTVDPSNVGVVTIYPGAWALRAFSKLSGGTLLGLQACNSSSTCYTGVNMVSSPVQGVAVSLSSQVKTVLANDSASSVSTSVQIKNWTGASSPTATLTSYPTSAVTATAALASGVYTVSSSSATAAATSAETNTSVSATLSGSTVSLKVTIPAYSAVLVTVQ